MTGSVESFKAKLLLWVTGMKMKSHMTSWMEILSDGAFSPLPFVGHLQTLLEQSEKRFQQFTITEPAFSVNHFTFQLLQKLLRALEWLIQLSVEQLELETVNLKNYVMKSCAICHNSWNPLDREKFLSLKNAIYEIKSYFGSTCLCKSLLKKQIPTDAHLGNCLWT